jgi:sugar lactone lactonase YvrE
LDVAAELRHGPSGLAVAPDNSLIVGLHQYFKTRERVVRVDRQGETSAFPSPEVAARDTVEGAEVLDSVMGVHGGDRGIIWMLDNGRRAEQMPKVVGWHFSDRKLHRVFHLPEPSTIATSFVADFAVDSSETHAYIADPASGADAALIVLDLRTGVSRRLLQGHISVVPQGIPLVVSGRKVHAECQDGSQAEPLAGVNPIALDKKAKYLYYGPLKGQKLYRIATSALNDASLSGEALASAVEEYSSKPICDSIAIDPRDNIYVGDLTANAIQVILPKDRRMIEYVADPKMAWPDGLTFGGDGRLYFYCSQLNRCSWFSEGQDETKAPFLVYRVKPLFQPMIANPLPDHNPLTEIRKLGERLKP